ncbi:MAG: transcription elongation factor GreA [Fimbriimonadaceae bacterium]|nr:transcription elongation factor GreA [Fimbriimonadaceae bacterium]QYK54813.1 MAG: transcription elongation factor GreA [Fimbriimonadaceae bacterium]
MEDLELEQSAPIVLTPEGHARLQAELTRLTGVKRAEIAERLRESMDHGEFSEDNSELDEVKLEQAIVENRISELRSIFSNAEILETSQIPTDVVGVGSQVEVEDAERGISFKVRLVSTVEANPDEDLISEESPMGQALFGCAVGELAEFEAPQGKIAYKILSISR